nr:hypothetical protein [Bacillus altitudinis]
MGYEDDIEGVEAVELDYEGYVGGFVGGGLGGGVFVDKKEGIVLIVGC